jgi:uncharacterized membrane protein
MVQTIGNPLTWGVGAARAAGGGIASAASHMGGRDTADITVREITMDDIRDALRAGFDDFTAMRSDVVFIVLFYPLIGAFLVYSAFNATMVPYIFPLASGFALLGPVAATGLYELSRRREAGQDVSWADAFAPFSAPSFGAIFGLGVYLLAVFMVWMAVAALIYRVTMGAVPPTSPLEFFGSALTTPAGFAMILIGIPVGAIFALGVLALTVVSFPLLVDRNVGLPRAVVTSVEVAKKNPRTVFAWGVIVAALMAIGSAPLFLGLIVVMPVLGHATWHLYRKAVVAAPPAV